MFQIQHMGPCHPLHGDGFEKLVAVLIAPRAMTINAATAMTINAVMLSMIGPRGLDSANGSEVEHHGCKS